MSSEVRKALILLAIVATGVLLGLAMLAIFPSGAEPGMADARVDDGRGEASRQGKVTVISGNKKYSPVASFDHGLADNVASDVLPILQRELVGELPVVPYESDFQILIVGEKTGAAVYAVYTEEWSDVPGMEAGMQPDFILPGEPGTYIIRMQIAWGEVDHYDAYDYVFRLEMP